MVTKIMKDTLKEIISVIAIIVVFAIAVYTIQYMRVNEAASNLPSNLPSASLNNTPSPLR